ncbi:DNA-binding protein [Jeotgalibaca sp. MA1X17-3]|uniref:DNA-binding protein n=1 Tax=Jeotgalibaca sp. MA1X17-3 TaxID=2908211 RepID=UPI001F3A53AA|nr:DNA-binding protein [Jeotgalibaca sp. MA1X17-3]UJF15010.1 DNA-binding protein [Jeotgalibaca sp. MA1X17-3]
MNNLQVTLNEEQTADLKRYIFELTKESIEQAKKNAGLDKPFLKQIHMSNYLGISVNTLKKLELEGLPSITLDGLKLYSKEEVSKWILQHQR